jgi:large subunit ribosomal protein L3
MKRYHFRGFRATHGTHEYFRHGGSIGCRLTPGRVYKGRRMPGQMGNEWVTVQNIRVYEVVPDRNLLLLRGAVPGAPGSYVVVKHAAKRLLPPFELIAPAPAPETTPTEEAAADG